jgi:hypothetical protein
VLAVDYAVGYVVSALSEALAKARKCPSSRALDLQAWDILEKDKIWRQRLDERQQPQQ